jgi:hypothetical protein
VGRLRLRLRVLHGMDEERPAGGKGKVQKGPPQWAGRSMGGLAVRRVELVGLINDWQVRQPACPAILACVALQGGRAGKFIFGPVINLRPPGSSID